VRWLALLACLLVWGGANAQTSFDKREEVQGFIRQMVEKHGFVEKELNHLFSRARREPAILAAIVPPGTRRVAPGRPTVRAS
jgi:membrane-bound lytic murein transglycosylase B